MSDSTSSTPKSQNKRQEKARQRSVIFYLGIMFTAAFLLLSLSLLMERRQRAEDMDDLNQSLTGLKNSVSAMQSVEQLYENNAALKDQILEDNSNGYALKEYLPTQSSTNNDRFSPADRYLEIYGKVN